MKLLKTILISTSLVSALLLWWTRDQYMPSLSSFALSDNALYYRLMHISASWFFLVNAIEFKKYVTEYVLALGMGLILSFDMYNHETLHNVITVATLGLACFTLLVNAEKSLDKGLAIVLVVASVAVFAVGYLVESFHFLMAEILAMAFLATGKLKEIWKST